MDPSKSILLDPKHHKEQQGGFIIHNWEGRFTTKNNASIHTYSATFKKVWGRKLKLYLLPHSINVDNV